MAGLAASAALTAPAVAATTPAPSASTATTTVPQPGAASGFELYEGRPAGTADEPLADLPGGYDVRVVEGTAHATRMTAAIEYAVAQLQRYGIDVRYRGAAPPSATATDAAPTPATITVGEQLAETGEARSKPNPDAHLITEAVTFPSVQDLAVAVRINGADVTFCPPVWSHDDNYLAAVALHELGHAVGLGHFTGRFDGSVQVMNPVVPTLSTYQAGDVNGLRYLIAQTAVLASESKLSGAVESWNVTARGLAVSGWAIVGRTAEFAQVDVTRDGRSVVRIGTSTARPDVVAAHAARWPNAGFAVGAVPMLPGPHEYCVRASAPGVPGPSVTLGCTRVEPLAAGTPAPPGLPALPSLGAAPATVWWRSLTLRVVLAAVAALLLATVALVLVRRRRS